ncbi:MAG: hypothetical protein ACM3SQ_19875 [Betaproteobacteria bacterium]
MRYARALGIAGALALTLAACGGSKSSTAPTPTAINLTGTWSGNLTFENVSGVMTWTLNQSGNSVTGPVLVSLPNGIVLLNGTLSGTLSGTLLTYTIAVAPGGLPTEPSCSGQLAGTVTVTVASPSRLAGSYSVKSTNCRTSISGGSFTLTQH